jgi:hypothetical protein
LIPSSEREFEVQGQSLQYMGKLTYLVNQDHSVSASIAGTPSSSGGGGVLSIDPQTGLLPATINGKPDSNAFGYAQELANSTSLALKYAGAFADKKVLVDANVGWFHQTVSTLPSDGSRLGSKEGIAGLALVQYRARRPIWYYEDAPNLQALCDEKAADTPSGTVACPTTNYFSGGPGFISDGKLDRLQMNAKATYLLELLGSHVLKAGADVELLGYNQTKAYTGRVYLREATDGSLWQDFRRYGFQSGPDAATPEFFQQSSTTSTTAGGFLQDSWTIVNRVTLNVGVRYDTQWLYGADKSLAFVLGNQISPRLGVIVDPMANGRMKVFANFARYYEQVPLNLLDRQFPGERRYVAYRNAGAGACDPANIDTHDGQRACLVDPTLEDQDNQEGNLSEIHGPTELNPSFTHAGGKVDRSPVDPNLKAQSSDEFLVGAEYELLANIRLGATYTHRNMNSVIEDMSRDDGNTYFLGNPGEGFAKEFPKAVRDYDAVTVFLNRTFSDGWLAQASYTWSRLEGNYPGLFRPENSQLDPNILSDFDLISLLKNRSGLLPYDRTHAVKLFGAKEFNFSNDLSASIGLSYRGNSGTPISAIGAHPTYGPSEAFILDRGSYGRTPWIHNIDGNIGVNYRISKSNVVSLSLDVFNIFNFQEYTAVDQNYTNVAVLPIEGGKVEGELTPDKVTRTNGKKLAEADLNRNFKNPTQYQAPRQVRIGLKYTF